MKIVHVMKWYIPKMSYQENFLPSEQKKLGHNVTIVTSDRVPHYQGYNNSVGNIIGNRIIGTGIFKENDVEIHRLPCFFEVIDGGQIIVKHLKEKLKELKPDVVHAHETFSPLTLITIFYSNKLGYKVFVDDHTHEDNFNLNSSIKKLYIFFNNLFYTLYGNRVCYWLPITSSAKNTLQNILNINNEKISLLPLGADTSKFKQSNKLRRIGRDKNNIEDNDFLIIFAGKFEEKKDIHLLIESFTLISQKYNNIKLLLVGNGPLDYMNKLKRMVPNSLSSKIIFKDFVPNSELPILYNAADLGVWPGNPSITVIEAVATGLPVIIPKEDLAYDLLLQRNSAEGFEEGSVESLSKSILKLLDNQDLRETISENCISLTSEILSWEKIAEKSISIYS